MNKSSIFVSITITFVSLFVFIIVSFGVLYVGSQKREAFFNHKRSFDVAHGIKNEMKHEKKITKELQEYLKLMDFAIVTNQLEILKSRDKKIEWQETRKKNEFLTRFQLQDKTYLHMKMHKNDILLIDKHESDDFRTVMIILFLFMLLGFALLYLNTIQKLRPLRTLQESVKNIGEEDFDILCATQKKDEISQLANEFDKSAKKLKALRESRNVFIRNIMHELKTPIAKGQILTQLPNTEENSESMQKVFYRLESLINEFASIEELISSKNRLQKKEYLLSDIIDNASDLLMGDEESLHQDFAELKVKVDFKLFSIAVKNLMDNAIKYSSDKRVIITTEGSSILFQNRAERLTRPIEEYFEPFFTTEHIQSQQSFGLGLYIVKHILDAHQFKLQYEHLNGLNRFIIICSSESS